MSDAEKSFQESEISGSESSSKPKISRRFSRKDSYNGPRTTTIWKRSPSRWKDDKDNLQINLLEDNDDISLASRETDTLASDLFKRPRLPSGSYAGDTPRSNLELSFRSNFPESVDDYSVIDHVRGNFSARLDSERGDTEFKSTENVYTEFFHDVRLKEKFTWDGIWPLIYTAMISIGIEVYREYLNNNFESVYDIYTMRIVSVFSILMILVYIAIMYSGSYPLMIALSLMVIINNFVCVQAAVYDIIGFGTSFREKDIDARYTQFLKYYLANILNPPLVLFQLNALRYTFLNIHAWRLGAIKFDKNRRDCRKQNDSSSEEDSSEEIEEAGSPLRPTETAL